MKTYMVCIVYNLGALQELLILEKLIGYFKRHGRSRSETAKDGYIKDALQKRLSVSQCLELKTFQRHLRGRVGCL